MLRLGVNIDHVATIRQARGTDYPNIVEAALLAVEAGADTITVHLREDRRHIQEDDVVRLKQKLHVPLNLEMAMSPDVIAIAKQVLPTYVCLVPENRQERTTEGGLDVVGQRTAIKKVSEQLVAANLAVSLFIEPEEAQIKAAHECGVPTIEIHTGEYARATGDYEHQKQLKRIVDAAQYAHRLGLTVNAGHGLTIHNVQQIAAIPVINELNIGHSLIARAIFIGLAEAVHEMKTLIAAAR